MLSAAYSIVFDVSVVFIMNWLISTNLDVIVQAYMSESFNNFEYIMKALLGFTGTSVHGVQMGWNLQIKEGI